MALVCDRCESRHAVEPRVINITKTSPYFTNTQEWSKRIDLCSTCQQQVRVAVSKALEPLSKKAPPNASQ